MNIEMFRQHFQCLTGNWPFPWQVQLFNHYFSKDTSPSVCSIPTGLGKTSVITIWLIALAEQLRLQHKTGEAPTLPRRLVYVVNRRTVVDQTTTEAEKLQAAVLAGKLPGISALAISTLRGQKADNREWSADPSRPAIIIGTVDLIGSRLLFSGYGLGRGSRPLHAGFLGQDALLIHDEAHLEPAFQQLIESIVQEQQRCRKLYPQADARPLRVMQLSATVRSNCEGTADFVTLQDEDQNSDVVKRRFQAAKKLTLHEVSEEKQTADKIVELALKHRDGGSAMLIFVRTLDDVKKVCDGLTNKKTGVPADHIQQLTGTMRGLERDQLVQSNPVFMRFLPENTRNPEVKPAEGTVYLICTSAGEVGIDISADHMVCDLSPLDSMIQRFGRVNRYGQRSDTRIELVHPASFGKTDKKTGELKAEAIDKARAATLEILKKPSSINSDSYDASPQALGELMASLTVEERQVAFSPLPTIPPATDILFDAWSLTSITQPMPGRPPVEPYLHGIADDAPQTTLAWRAELDLPGFADLVPEDLEEWFDTHRLLTHEQLTVTTSSAAKWFMERYESLAENLTSEQLAALKQRPVWCDRGGWQLITLQTILDQLSRKNTDGIRHATLILPASFGGIKSGVGLLDANAPLKPEDPKDADAKTLSENAELRLLAPDVADILGQRFRQITTRDESCQTESFFLPASYQPVTPLPNHARLTLTLESDDDRHVQLVSYVPKPEKPDWGSRRQALAEHVGEVRKQLDAMLPSLDFPDAIQQALQLAADYHDHGKNRERWQSLVGGQRTPSGQSWQDHTLGKSDGTMKRDPRRYRHEFGSLREFHDAFHTNHLHDPQSRPIPPEVFELAMHLIAAHHGRARPHFDQGGFDPDCESRSDELHTQIIQRFARLQRKYGRWGLAYLESLLRAADWAASAAPSKVRSASSQEVNA